MEPFKTRIEELEATKQISEPKEHAEIDRLIFWNKHWMRYYKLLDQGKNPLITTREPLLDAYYSGNKK